MTEDKRWKQIREGVVGHFEPCPTTANPGRPGMLRLGGEGATAVLSVDDEFFDDEHLPPECSALVGRTEVGSVLLFGVSERSGTIGGYPTARYRAQSLVLDAQQDQVDADTVSAVRLGYEGLTSWSGVRNLTDDHVRDDEGAVIGWNVELRFRDPTVTDLDAGYRLHIAAGWSVDGPSDRRTIAAPLYFRVESATRRSIGKHLQRLDAVHALLAVCHDQGLKATTGDVRLVPDDGKWCGLWERHMMALDTASVRQDFPRLQLGDIGGTDGVARWVRLVLLHRRAVEPVVRHTLFSNQTPEARMLSTAAAMEYWVGVNARTQAWAKRDGSPLPNALMKRVHEAWAVWIGRPKAWVERFWETYLDLKHFRGPEHDPVEIHALEISGRWLLTAALLDECAGTLEPSQRLFGKSLWQLGADVRTELFASPEA